MWFFDEFPSILWTSKTLILDDFSSHLWRWKFWFWVRYLWLLLWKWIVILDECFVIIEMTSEIYIRWKIYLIFCFLTTNKRKSERVFVYHWKQNIILCEHRQTRTLNVNSDELFSNSMNIKKTTLDDFWLHLWNWKFWFSEVFGYFCCENED